MDEKTEKKEDYEKIRIILLVDEKLSELEVKVLNQFFTISFFDKKLDTHRRLQDLAEVEVFVIKIDHSINEESKAMIFLQNNSNRIKDDYYLIYKRTKNIIDKKNLPTLNCDFITDRIPVMDLLNRADFLEKLYTNKMPHIKSNLRIFCDFLLLVGGLFRN